MFLEFVKSNNFFNSTNCACARTKKNPETEKLKNES